jgi:hypothetical protein
VRTRGYTTQFGRRWRAAIAFAPGWRSMWGTRLWHSPQGCPRVYTIHTLNIHIGKVHVTLVLNTMAKGF